MRHSQDNHRDGEPRRANEKDRASADSVGEASPERGKEELHRGIAHHEPSQRRGRGAEDFAVVRKNRDDDPKTDQIEENDEKEN